MNSGALIALNDDEGVLCMPTDRPLKPIFTTDAPKLTQMAHLQST